ncbi:hypothetical protein [Companilactobacillus mishanensis]|uniref:DUF1433 domain-containing protein n=1 Tax=Companilactobacillus mishanensis TaxID=2486008 RepID=A0A5P0ZKB2_9LACO|nr:hypothetical protein [Companilactobacillus mishanensis]MQS53556.1 hypothetical protein [Companilactobacillus mishanensis]
MAKNKKLIISLCVLVSIFCVGSISFGIKTFFKDQEAQREQFYKKSEDIIVEGLEKKYRDIESVTFTFVAPTNSFEGYRYSFYVNHEIPNKNGDSLWSSTIVDGKTIDMGSYPRSGKYAFKRDDTPSDLTRKNCLKKANIKNVTIHYRLKTDR